MRTRILLITGTLLVVAGCGAMTTPTPEFSPARECDRSGGYWHPALSVCEPGR